ncbi:uncharacterized protein TRIADDRAFT_52720 [Trichoplax adhaerens]|uniref:Tetratricopeptide repeat protein 7 N-terminal domain-containing protein n=1 Tax=Trichoplax adhaerens TaxID=10228 RepID=B3RJY4_TRIAD|nr:hypothetical protein TRIADDRAFT_52720 [Trichoplax adhaerens]EDV29864.1 hypothetical protein TRIADDRAFT_52720 [Trichoplax adhaerens]|eukprot:XP_002109066.1 hypothetical protein TRIADDRAFT_52720 [Trichoplax adhaerens]
MSRKKLDIESSVEKARNERDWHQLASIADSIREESIFKKLITIEGELEILITANSIPSDKRNEALSRLKRQLMSIGNDTKIKQQYQQESLLLLAKTCYYLNLFKDATRLYSKLQLESIDISDNSNKWFIRTVCEAYCYKGKCLDKLRSTSADIIKCYESASSLMMKLDVSNNFNKERRDSTSKFVVGEFLEECIGTMPSLLLDKCSTSDVIRRSRFLLVAFDSNLFLRLRALLSYHLAEILLFRMSDHKYLPVTLKSIMDFANQKYSWVKPSLNGKNLYFPDDITEEVLLLSLITEMLTIKDIENIGFSNLNRLRNIYDLLAVVLMRRSLIPIVAEVYERALKYSMDIFHVWFQFSLSLIANRKVDDAEFYASKVIDQKESRHLLANAHLILGITYSRQASSVLLINHRKKLQERALNSLEKAYELAPGDYRTSFHLALNYAFIRDIVNAVHYNRIALQLNRTDLRCLHLAALLLSAQKKGRQALDICDIAATEYPDNFSLMFLKAKLEEVYISGNQALDTYKTILVKYHLLSKKARLHENKARSDIVSTASYNQLAYSDDASSLSGISTTGSKGLSSYLDFELTPRLLTKIWLSIADIYIQLGRLSDAEMSIKEASMISSKSVDVMHYYGRLLESKGNLREAKQYYDNVLAGNHDHFNTLLHLGFTHHELGNLDMAEKFFLEAIKVEPAAHCAWNALGAILQERNCNDTAAEVFLLASDFESTSPVSSFYSIAQFI